MAKLQSLKSIDEDPATVKAACFYVGWHLLSADSWAYHGIFTGKRGVVDLDKLIKAVAAKKLLLNPEKPKSKHREKAIFTIDKNI
jgi:hypothetical protein